jgi:hypothetical protein
MEVMSTVMSKADGLERHRAFGSHLVLYSTGINAILAECIMTRRDVDLNPALSPVYDLRTLIGMRSTDVESGLTNDAGNTDDAGIQNPHPEKSENSPTPPQACVLATPE